MRNLLFLVFVLLCCTGCSHYYYAPNMHNVPLFQEKNELRLNIAAGTGDELNTAEVQAAFSPTNHLGLMANYINGNGGSGDDDNGKGFLIEAGAGYFAPVEERFVIEIYGGIGAGKISNQYYDGNLFTGSSSLNFIRGFIQPNIGFTTPYFDLAISPRVCLLNYTRIEADHLSDSRGINDLEYIAGHKTAYILEPAITLKGGWKYFKIQTQWVMARTGNGLPISGTNFNVGLYLSFAEKFKAR